ncbi:phage antirepressor [Christensenellaceae bacterium OttesenSCG-928-K19]|nr:phage antirepressor [Christensenellaceae bacterium OttesenSCG-928-K19]
MKNKNQLQQFHSREFGKLEVLMINDKAYFPATECAKILGYTNPQKAIRDHCKGVNETFTPSAGGMQKTRYIPEGDLYRLIIRSKLPAAERFESWVFDEVLPTIRKHGAYATYDTLDELLRSPKFADTLINRLEDERQRSTGLRELAEEMAPKALYCDLVLQAKNLVPVSLIAKDYGMSATAFNNMLYDLGVQYPMSGTWLLYQQYAKMGYTRTRTYYVGSGASTLHTCWTQKGRMFLYEFLRDFGILPLAESPLPA